MTAHHENTPAENPVVNLIATEADEGVRLDAYLAARIEGWSRARLQRLIDDQDVLVNGRSVKSSYKLRVRDEIEVELSPGPSASFAPENIPLDVVYEDEHVVVVNKPRSGVNSSRSAV